MRARALSVTRVRAAFVDARHVGRLAWVPLPDGSTCTGVLSDVIQRETAHRSELFIAGEHLDVNDRVVVSFRGIVSTPAPPSQRRREQGRSR